ncbi:nSTAND1 domain-containing NTPase [Laspinema palackyanum]|uniref:nSTAND1 domain-containing NTPase n=1 Tax=Laspinema palackyanum TaxID=3231601 RepID=UPI00345D5297|nr:hypothetical protein [Laspinema sp. D2c]
MNHSFNPEQISPENEKALKKLAWALEASRGEFKLFIARCNYIQLRDRLAQRLQQLCSVEIRRIEVKAGDRLLHSRIRLELGEEQPDALMVFGLEIVTDIQTLLSSANQVREEFQNHFHFPLVLWVNDEVQKKVRQIAPDLESWAIPVQFTMDREAIASFVTATAQSWFANQLQLTRQSALKLQGELAAAQQDLISQGGLDEELNANLESLLGAVKFILDSPDLALVHYQLAANWWDKSHQLERLGKIYHQIAVCHYIKARKQRNLEPSDWQPTREALAQCLATFEQTENPHLIADSLDSIGKILRQLQDWETLQHLATEALSIHETQNQPQEAARDYGFLGEVALSQEDWNRAKELAEKALEILTSNFGVVSEYLRGNLHPQPEERRVLYDASLYYFILAQAEQNLNHPEPALGHLEAAKQAGSPDNDTKLYIDILCQLHILYFRQKQYLEAFHIKLTRYSVEQQYGIRAFVGACWIQPQRQESFGLILGEKRETVAPEIAASGRMLDVEKIVQEIGENNSRILVIHGQSGVGKSSLVNGGIIPKLKENSMGYEEYLPIAVRVYTNWKEEFANSLAEALAEKGITGQPVPGSEKGQLELFLKQLQENEQRNRRSILIFDQFEEFFFACPTPRERRQFFNFLGDCLSQIVSIKVILSLREDYLHELLACDRLESMMIINNDILARKVRYPLGNFLPEDAQQIIQRLTEKSQIWFPDALIKELVQELAAELDAVRPIELQIVGAQLQAENITTLAEYQERGPKTEFVKRYLDDVVKDCGLENQEIGERVLYLLTDEKGTRPLKTREEIAQELQELAADLTGEVSQLDLVLKIFVDSGLVLLIQEKPAERYQLVHDYLAEFIRKQQQPQLERLRAELEQERTQRKLLEAERQKTQEELEQERKAKQILAEASKKAAQRIRLSTRILAASLIAATITGGLAIKATQTLEEAREGTRLEREGLNALRQFEAYQLDGLVSAMSAGQELKALVKHKRSLSDYPTLTPMLALHTIINQISERNKLQHQDSVSSASFSPDGESIVTASSDNTARVWERRGQMIAELKGHQGRVWNASFSPDGESIVTASEDNTARVWERSGKLVAELTGHQGSVSNASFSPEGENILTVSDDNTARVWDRRGQMIAELKGHQGRVWNASFSPDGESIVTASEDNTARVWERRGQMIAELKGHQGLIGDASFSPDGESILTASDDNTARVWERRGQMIAELKGHQGAVWDASFSPDGESIITASDDKTARVWDRSGQMIAELTGHQSAVWDASFSPDGKSILTVSDDTARVWERSGQMIAELKGHQGRLRSASFSQDGQSILTASSDNIARVWDRSGQRIAELKGHQGLVWNASFSPDGESILTASDDNTARVWDRSGQRIAKLKGHQDGINSASFSPDGESILTTSDDNTAQVWDRRGQRIAELKGHPMGVFSGSFSPDGESILTVSHDDTARVWDLHGQMIAELKGHQNGVFSASFSPDGESVVTASNDKTARVWNLRGQMIAELKGHQNGVYSASFSPDGESIVTASEDNTARVWDRRGQMIAELKGHQGTVYSASFSPDGESVVTASEDNTARVWDRRGQMIAELKGHQGTVWNASFSPDGESVVTASNDKTARVWNLRGQMIAELKGHQGTVWNASFSPDGERILTASEDNTARVWDRSGKLVAELTGHQDGVNSASFSPDGERILTASWDKTARVWPVGSLDELLEWGCDWLGDYLVTHPRELEKLETCQTPSNLAEAAIYLVREGEVQARAGQVDAAVATFRKALKWNAELDFNPEVKAKQLAEEGNPE